MHHAYRGTTLAVRLARMIHHNPPARLELDVISGQCVCNHTKTQALGNYFGSVVCAP